MLPFLLSLALLAADPPPNAGPIRLMPLNRAVTPTPMPSADAPIPLNAGELYVVASKVECVVRSHPPGCVTAVPKAGPKDVSAKFVGGTGDPDEDRSFAEPFLYYVRATHAGCVEVEVIPFGLTKASEIVVVKFDVLGGCKVGPVDPVTPPGPADPFAAAVLSAYAADTAPDKVAVVARLASVYRVAARTTASDPGVKTYGDLFADMESASRAIGVPPLPYLAGVRKAVGDRLGKTLESRSSPIDRALAAKELAAVADALAGCK